MVNYKLTDDAREDLCEIKGFSLRQFGSLTAREYLAGMRVTMQHLANMPGMGTNEVESLGLDIWSFPYMSHTTYYQRAADGISIIGVVHQNRLPTLLLNRRI
ncbi:TPA: type II toxin-antitoxin system RelE/ParE family toxin [Serratia fonticola]|jgi:toxin ParE1/3/4|uniref:Type II toxin-antitoxin system RelE/ParE family toxin n=1 Tax=Serratia fonticola TaxID=47917 RepID=A0AAE7EFU5_SERFO|nr:type II toxin-antitoxin system RelE/ParE family toxin [Serratia fonticola]QKJ57734.1 type II toxin-antitoxin system RelE/ParE family toxin [Serratia fonticola]HEJ9055955.1 type II toxin-antitoxin system RelE/ParE family toxin [Serratia fonticola]